MASCKTLPNALRRSNQAKKQFLRFLLQSATTDCRVNVCSWQPFEGLALFCCDDNKLLLLAKFETRADKLDVNSLHRQDINAMGLKLLGSSSGPFLWMKVVVEFFHVAGILRSPRHLLKMVPRTLQFGSTSFKCLYSTLSLPGAEFDIDLNFDLISFCVIGAIIEGSSVPVGT